MGIGTQRAHCPCFHTRISIMRSFSSGMLPVGCEASWTFPQTLDRTSYHGMKHHYSFPQLILHCFQGRWRGGGTSHRPPIPLITILVSRPGPPVHQGMRQPSCLWIWAPEYHIPSRCCSANLKLSHRDRDAQGPIPRSGSQRRFGPYLWHRNSRLEC